MKLERKLEDILYRTKRVAECIEWNCYCSPGYVNVEKLLVSRSSDDIEKYFTQIVFVELFYDEEIGTGIIEFFDYLENLIFGFENNAVGAISNKDAANDFLKKINHELVSTLCSMGCFTDNDSFLRIIINCDDALLTEKYRKELEKYIATGGYLNCNEAHHGGISEQSVRILASYFIKYQPECLLDTLICGTSGKWPLYEEHLLDNFEIVVDECINKHYEDFIKLLSTSYFDPEDMRFFVSRINYVLTGEANVLDVLSQKTTNEQAFLLKQF